MSRTPRGWDIAGTDHLPKNGDRTSAESDSAHRAGLAQLALEQKIDAALELAINDLEAELGLRRIEVARELVQGACRLRDQLATRG